MNPKRRDVPQEGQALTAREAAMRIIEGAGEEEQGNLEWFLAMRKRYTFAAMIAAWHDTRNGVILAYPEDLALWAKTFQPSRDEQIRQVLMVIEMAYAEQLAGNCRQCGDAAPCGVLCGECVGEIARAIIAEGLDKGWHHSSSLSVKKEFHQQAQAAKCFYCFDCGKQSAKPVCEDCARERGSQC